MGFYRVGMWGCLPIVIYIYLYIYTVFVYIHTHIYINPNPTRWPSLGGSIAVRRWSLTFTSIKPYGVFHKWRYPNGWMVYNGKSYYKWMRTGGTPISGNLNIKPTRLATSTSDVLLFCFFNVSHRLIALLEAHGITEHCCPICPSGHSLWANTLVGPVHYQNLHRRGHLEDSVRWQSWDLPDLHRSKMVGRLGFKRGLKRPNGSTSFEEGELSSGFEWIQEVIHVTSFFTNG